MTWLSYTVVYQHLKMRDQADYSKGLLRTSSSIAESICFLISFSSGRKNLAVRSVILNYVVSVLGCVEKELPDRLWVPKIPERGGFD